MLGGSFVAVFVFPLLSHIQSALIAPPRSQEKAPLLFFHPFFAALGPGPRLAAAFPKLRLAYGKKGQQTVVPSPTPNSSKAPTLKKK